MLKRLTRVFLAVVMAATAWTWYPAMGVAHATALCPTYPFGGTPYDSNYNDSASVNVGVKFKVRGAPSVTSVKFYKGVDNTGTHIAHLYDATTSTNLASEQFTSETSSGWQTVDFDSPVDVDPTHDYMVWVSMPNGHYAVDGTPGGTQSFYNNGFGDSEDPVYIEQGDSGVYEYSNDDSAVPTNDGTNNYWVVPVVDDDITPDNLTGKSASAETEGQVITWTGGGKDTNSETSTADPIKYKVTRIQGESGDVQVGYFPGNSTSIVDPTLTNSGSNYFYQIKSIDACGNTSNGGTSVQGASESVPALSSIFNNFGMNPPVLDSGQTDPLTVGMRWNSAVDGNVWGVRFYRDASTTPTAGNFKVGLWDNNGDLLASRDLPNGYSEGGTGWYDVRFDEPVAVEDSHDYVVGYYSPNGKEMYISGKHSSAVTSGDLTAVADGSGTPNGVYNTSSSFAFPSTQSSSSAWYGVDVLFY